MGQDEVESPAHTRRTGTQALEPASGVCDDQAEPNGHCDSFPLLVKVLDAQFAFFSLLFTAFYEYVFFFLK